MGPKIEAVTCANVPAKDLSWIDRMYLKLENMCVEVDKNPSFLLQETSKYVESQMDVVGANVKKLCAEFIQDLLPPPVLSSEGADKKPECAIHCNCDCVDSEKPKQKTTNKTIEGGNRNAGIEEVQAKGVNATVSEFEEVKTHLSEFEEGSSSFGNSDKKNIIEVKNITEVGAIKFEERKKEVATQQQETSEAADFEGHTRKSEVNGEEHSNTIEQGAMEGEEKKIKVQQQETGQFAEFEEQLSRSKESARQSEASGDEHSHNCRQVEAHNRNTAEDVLINIEEKTTEVAVQQCVHGREAEFEGHTRRPQEGESEELGISIGQIQAHKENKAEKGVTEVEERGIEDKMQQQESKASLEGHTSRLKDSAKICMETYDFDCERQQSMKDTDLHKEMDDDAKSMYSSVSSAEDTEVGAEERDEVGGDLKSMYSYDLGELSGSSKEENPMTTSAYLIEEENEDEEQSARWFVGEDHRNIFQMENFSFPSLFDKSPQTQRPVEEFDFDWELL